VDVSVTFAFTVRLGSRLRASEIQRSSSVRLGPSAFPLVFDLAFWNLDTRQHPRQPKTKLGRELEHTYSTPPTPSVTEVQPESELEHTCVVSFLSTPPVARSLASCTVEPERASKYQFRPRTVPRHLPWPPVYLFVY
jgi:hypothetical protein